MGRGCWYSCRHIIKENLGGKYAGIIFIHSAAPFLSDNEHRIFIEFYDDLMGRKTEPPPAPPLAVEKSSNKKRVLEEDSATPRLKKKGRLLDFEAASNDIAKIYGICVFEGDPMRRPLQYKVKTYARALLSITCITAL